MDDGDEMELNGARRDDGVLFKGMTRYAELILLTHVLRSAELAYVLQGIAAFAGHPVTAGTLEQFLGCQVHRSLKTLLQGRWVRGVQIPSLLHVEPHRGWRVVWRVNRAMVVLFVNERMRRGSFKGYMHLAQSLAEHGNYHGVLEVEAFIKGGNNGHVEGAPDRGSRTANGGVSTRGL